MAATDSVVLKFFSVVLNNRSELGYRYFHVAEANLNVALGVINGAHPSGDNN